jgi:hypothetical protein
MQELSIKCHIYTGPLVKIGQILEVYLQILKKISIF